MSKIFVNMPSRRDALKLGVAIVAITLSQSWASAISPPDETQPFQVDGKKDQPSVTFEGLTLITPEMMGEENVTGREITTENPIILPSQNVILASTMVDCQRFCPPGLEADRKAIESFEQGQITLVLIASQYDKTPQEFSDWMYKYFEGSGIAVYGLVGSEADLKPVHDALDLIIRQGDVNSLIHSPEVALIRNNKIVAHEVPIGYQLAATRETVGYDYPFKPGEKVIADPRPQFSKKPKLMPHPEPLIEAIKKAFGLRPLAEPRPALQLKEVNPG